MTPNKGGNRHKGEKRGSALFVSEAESQTGIAQQQVSKWRRRLKEPEKYQAMLYGAAYAKAIAMELKSEGKTQEQVAAALGVARNTISVWLIGNVNDDNADIPGPDSRVKLTPTTRPAPRPGTPRPR